MTKHKLIWVRIAPKNPDSNLGYVYAYFSEMGLRIRIEMIRKLFTPYKYIQTRKFLQKVPLHFCKARSVYVSYRLVRSRGYWMKNGFIGSEQTTITCAHIIDLVWNFGEREAPRTSYMHEDWRNIEDPEKATFLDQHIVCLVNVITDY